jgi:hypothetical protein
VALPTTPRIPGEKPRAATLRRDAWWLKPLLTVTGLLGFGVYASFRAFENRFYEAGPYLSPFYSPLLPVHGSIAGWAVSPAFYVLIFPLTFRLTCYYYRQAYYRAFFWSPPACAVPEPAARKRYRGERAFPLVLQNLHRYTFYAGVIFMLILAADAIRAFDFNGRFGMGLGTLIMAGNVVLLAGYTFGCNSLRHLIGGRMDCFTCPQSGSHEKLRAGYHGWRWVSMLNRNHMQWAWLSLFSVALTDLYIRLCAAGVIADVRFF